MKTARNEKVNIYFSFKCFHKTLYLLLISVSSSHSLRWINRQEYMKIWSPSHSISVVIIHVTLVPTQLMNIFRRKKCHFCAASLQHIQTWSWKEALCLSIVRGDVTQVKGPGELQWGPQVFFRFLVCYYSRWVNTHPDMMQSCCVSLSPDLRVRE